MLAQVNATLTAVRGPSGTAGTQDDWDTDGEAAPEAPGATRWEGTAPAYYRESTLRAPSAGGADVSMVRTLILETDVARRVGVRVADVVEGADAAGRPIRAIVREVAVADLPGLPSAVRSTRLELEST